MCDGCHAHVTADDAAPAPCPGSPPWPGAEPDPAAELAALIAAQARDDADRHAPRHKREIPATDLNGRVDVLQGRIEHGNGKDWRGWQVMRERAVDHRCSPKAWQEAAHQAMDDAASAAVRSGGENRAGRIPGPGVPLVLVGEGMIWGAAVAGYRPEGGACPACGDSLLPAGWICLCCHATRDRPVRWPMQSQAVKRAGKAKGKRAKARTQTAT